MNQFHIFLAIVFSPLSGFAQTEVDVTPDDHPMDMVGTWCFIDAAATSTTKISNSCLTLNADGTYDVQLDPVGRAAASARLPAFQQRDSGTWWVQAGKLYYSSSTLGAGSFYYQKANHPRLENVPTLLLEGLIFCATTAHDPW